MRFPRMPPCVPGGLHRPVPRASQAACRGPVPRALQAACTGPCPAHHRQPEGGPCPVHSRRPTPARAPRITGGLHRPVPHRPSFQLNPAVPRIPLRRYELLQHSEHRIRKSFRRRCYLCKELPWQLLQPGQQELHLQQCLP